MSFPYGLGKREFILCQIDGLLHDIGELYSAPAYLEPGKHLLPHEWAQLDLNLNHGLNDAHDGVLTFEKAVATREIQWRLRDTARDLALHTAGSPDEKSLFANLLGDDSDSILLYTPKAAPAPKLAALSPTSFAGSQPYAT